MLNKGDEIVFVDTETTGLVQSKGTDLLIQPYITEICAIRTNWKLKPLRELNTLVMVPVEIDNFITKHTGIDNAMLEAENAPWFAEIFKQVKSIFKGADRVVAQNLSFDLDMIGLECERINKPNPVAKVPDKFCTVEQSMHFRGFRLNSQELHEAATGHQIEQAHRAKNDVLAMIKYYRMMVSEFLPKHLRR